MKIIITILVLVGVGIFILFHGNTSKTDVPVEEEQATGVFVDNYNKYQGAVDGAQAAVSAIEDRNKIPNE